MTPRKRKRSQSSTPKKTTIIKTEIEDTVSFSPSPKKDRKVRKPARHVKTEDGEVKIHAPSDWQELYAVAKEMRQNGAAKMAAVDTMGCESYTEDEKFSPRDKRFHTLIALMLSSQTKDTTNFATMNRLKKELPACKDGEPTGLNLENILAVKPDLLNELIWAVGFHNNKTRYIKATAEILRGQYEGDIPDSAEGLMSLPGVGPKMAYLCLSSAWGRDEGIGVDVHVHRITNMWGWHKTKNPEETRIALQEWLPKELWHEINWLLVGLGQTVCLPVGRKCGECELGLQGLCKAAERGKIIAGRKIKEEQIKLDESGEVEKVEENIKNETEVLGEVVMNAAPDAEVLVPGQEELAAEEGLSKGEERQAIEEMVNGAGQFEKTPTRASKRKMAS